MHPSFRLVVGFVVAACGIAVPGVRAEDRMTLSADVWINPLSFRVPENREIVVLFFDTDRSRENEMLIDRFNKLAQCEDRLVIGLTPESDARLREFVDRYNVRFAVGAGSRSYRDMNVKRFPTVLTRRPFAEGAPFIEVPLSQLLDSTVSFEEIDIPDPLECGAFDATTDSSTLRRHAASDERYQERIRAVGALRDRAASEFMRLCDELLEHETHPAVRGAIAYQRHLLDPSVTVKEPLLAPSTQAMQEMRDDPEAPQWEAYNTYRNSMPSRSAAQLAEDYFEHLTDLPSDLLIRKAIPRAIRDAHYRGEITSEEGVDLLRQMLPHERDFATRQRAVGMIGELAKPGDLETISFLQDMLAKETNIRVVRPMLEFTIKNLRAEGDARATGH